MTAAELGHTTRGCPEEAVENPDKIEVKCVNCDEVGHREYGELEVRAEIGLLIILEASTSTTDSGPFAKASGLVFAQARAATATSAICSRVVPYW